MTIPKNSPLWRAWAGGVADARMSWPSKNEMLRLESTDSDLIHGFRERTGVGCLINRGQRNGTVSDLWEWRTTNMDDTRTVCLFVGPFLGPTNAKKAVDLIRRIEANKQWRKKHPEKAEKSLLTKGVPSVKGAGASQSGQTDGASVTSNADASD